jgi:hypothetical protein
MVYEAFGLGLSSSNAIPRLTGSPIASRIDVRIELGRRPHWYGEESSGRVRYESSHCDDAGRPGLVVTEFDNAWLHLGYPDGAAFWVDSTGSEIWVTWTDPLTIDGVSSYLLGPVMGLVLRLRGRVCLHASALAANGHAFAIIGSPGAGKSTTAAALGARGYAVLADDIVALAEIGGVIHAYPGYPRLRLWPSALGVLAEADRSSSSIPFGGDESRYHLDVTRHGYRFQSTPLPLTTIYALDGRSDRSDAPRVEPMAGEERLIALLANSFANALLDREMRTHELDLLGRLASSIRIMRVTPHTDSGRLADMCDLLIGDLLANSAHACHS